MKKSIYTFWGTGSSLAIPVIGCLCSTCLSSCKKNKRSRPAGLLEIGDKKILLDVGPDIYHQIHAYGLDRLDGVMLTHTHYDHAVGLDELRIFSMRQKMAMPLLVSEDTKRELEKNVSYLFQAKEGKLPKFGLQTLDPKKNTTEFLGIKLSYVFYKQTGMQVTGYRIGDFAFLTDIKEYEDTIFYSLEGIKTLVLSAIDWSPTNAHISIQQALAIAEKLKVKSLYITHIGHELEHEMTGKKLPPFAFLAYDGLKIEFSEKI